MSRYVLAVAITVTKESPIPFPFPDIDVSFDILRTLSKYFYLSFTSTNILAVSSEGSDKI